MTLPRQSMARPRANTLLFLTLFPWGRNRRHLDLAGLGQLLVKCPRCGALYQSGIVTDFEVVHRNLGNLLEARTTCPFCRYENSDKRNMIFTSAPI
jgi:hypothetical protein